MRWWSSCSASPRALEPGAAIKKPGSAPAGLCFRCAAASRKLRVDHALEALERHHADLLAGRLGLEHHLLAGERVDAFARLGGRLLHDLHLEKTGHREQTVAAQALLDNAAERIEDAADLFAGQPRVFGDVCQDFRLRRCATLFRHFALLLEELVLPNAATAWLRDENRREK